MMSSGFIVNCSLAKYVLIGLAETGRAEEATQRKNLLCIKLYLLRT